MINQLETVSTNIERGLRSRLLFLVRIMPRVPIAQTMTADWTKAVALGAPDPVPANRKTGKVMKTLIRMNMTLIIKMTGLRFLKVRPYQLTVRGAQDTRGTPHPQGNRPVAVSLRAN